MQTKISWINIDIVLTQKLNWARQNMLGTLKKVLNTKEVLVKEWRRRHHVGNLENKKKKSSTIRLLLGIDLEHVMN